MTSTTAGGGATVHMASPVEAPPFGFIGPVSDETEHTATVPALIATPTASRCKSSRIYPTSSHTQAHISQECCALFSLGASSECKERGLGIKANRQKERAPGLGKARVELVAASKVRSSAKDSGRGSCACGFLAGVLVVRIEQVGASQRKPKAIEDDM